MKYGLSVLLTLVLTVASSAQEDVCDVSIIPYILNDCESQIAQLILDGGHCSASLVVDTIYYCTGNCKTELQDNSRLRDLMTIVNNAQSMCAVAKPRNCDVTSGLSCALVIPGLITAAGQIASTNVNDAAAVCSLVDTFAGAADACQSFIINCVGLIDNNISPTTDLISDIATYVLVATGDSCVVMSETLEMVNTLAKISVPQPVNSGSCRTAQSELSKMLKNSRLATEAIDKANPFKTQYPFLSVDFVPINTLLFSTRLGALASSCALTYEEDVSSGNLSTVSLTMALAIVLVHIIKQML